jgi:DNA-directed RNA polymerase
MEKVFIKKDLKINNPILFDASCSGIQHLSAMTKEVDMAIQVNLIPTSENPELDAPKDFYTYALERVREALRKHPKEVLNKISLNRKIIKKSVMTIPYNISLTGIGEHLMEHFSKIKDNEGKKYIGVLVPKEGVLDEKDLLLNYSEFGHLTKTIYFVLTKEMPSLKLLGEYLDSLITILVEFNLPII